MSSIALCMIVKNEEKYLSKCLNSIKNLVDEIIVVDTGSTDKTKEIALDYGAQVYHFNWINDFSAARNYALEQATADWILVLDADESVREVNKTELLNKLETTKNIAFEVEIHNLSHENKAPFIHKSVRFFKNNIGIKFMHKVHEQPSIEGKTIPYYELNSVPITIDHIGYREDVVADKNKETRNFEILKEELKRKPNDQFLNYNIANEYLKKEDYLNALYHYKIATNNKRDNQMLGFSILRMVLALYELKRFEEMFALLTEGQARFPDYTDIYYFQGDILEKLGRDEEAKRLYELCLLKGNPKKNYITRQGIGDVLPLSKLSDLYIKSGYFKKAADALIKLLRYNKYDKKVVINLMKLYKMSFSNRDLEIVLKELYPYNEGEELLFKLELAYFLRIPTLFVETYQLWKEKNLESETIKEYEFYYYLAKNEYEIAKELVIQKNHNDLACFQYYLLTNDDSIIDYANEPVKKILDFFESGRIKVAFDLPKETFFTLIEELIRLGTDEQLEKGLELSVLFDSKAMGELGNLFYSYLKLEKAAQFYLKYLKDNDKDFMVTLVVAEIYLILGYEIDAIKFAHHAMNLNNEHFKSIEIILESYKQIGEVEQAKALAKEMLKEFPYDGYFKKI